MTGNRDDPNLLGIQEARSFCDRETDPVVRQLLEGLLTALISRRHSGDTPCTDMDVLFVLRAARSFFLRRDSLERILAGEDLHWWTDPRDGLPEEGG